MTPSFPAKRTAPRRSCRARRSKGCWHPRSLSHCSVTFLDTCNVTGCPEGVAESVAGCAWSAQGHSSVTSVDRRALSRTVGVCKTTNGNQRRSGGMGCTDGCCSAPLQSRSMAHAPALPAPSPGRQVGRPTRYQDLHRPRAFPPLRSPPSCRRATLAAGCQRKCNWQVVLFASADERPATSDASQLSRGGKPPGPRGPNHLNRYRHVLFAAMAVA